MSIYQTHLDVTTVKCLVTTKINVSELEHSGPSGVCGKPAKCVNCSGDHPVNSKQCQQWEKEKKILKINAESIYHFLKQVNNKINFTEVKPMQVL